MVTLLVADRGKVPDRSTVRHTGTVSIGVRLRAEAEVRVRPWFHPAAA